MKKSHTLQQDLLPTPLARLLELFEKDLPQPFRQVHRLIDAFEWAIKWHTVLAVSALMKKAELTPKIKVLFSSGLRTPSLGTWIRFYRESLEAFGSSAYGFVNFPKHPKPQS